MVGGLRGFGIGALVCCWAIFTSQASHARLEIPLGDIESELGAEPKGAHGVKQKFQEIVHKLRFGGKDDRPFYVQFDPLVVKLPKKHGVPADLLEAKRKIRLDTINISRLEALTTEELNNLVHVLGTIPVKVRWEDRRGHYRSGNNRKHKKRTLGLAEWDETNAAAALTLAMGSFKEQYQFAKMLALYPDAILPEIRGPATSLLDPETAALALVLMMDNMGPDDTGSTSESAATLTTYFLQYWAHKNDVNLQKHLHRLFVASQALLATCDHTMSEKKAGIMLGSILAGALIHVDSITKKDEKRVWIVNTASNLIWAATAFLGMAPMMGAQAMAAVSGTISLGAVAGAAVYQKVGMHDDQVPSIKQIEGHIQVWALDACLKADDCVKTRVLTMLSYINAAIHLNGLSD
jgi:hypothetical protein